MALPASTARLAPAPPARPPGPQLAVEHEEEHMGRCRLSQASL